MLVTKVTGKIAWWIIILVAGLVICIVSLVFSYAIPLFTAKKMTQESNPVQLNSIKPLEATQQLIKNNTPDLTHYQYQIADKINHIKKISTDPLSRFQKTIQDFPKYLKSLLPQ